MNLLVLSFILCGLARVQAIEVCGPMFGGECITTCTANYDKKAESFPYCYSGKECCKAKPTTATTATTTTTTTTTQPTVSPHKQCGINAIAVSGRIVNSDQQYTFNDMNCAWPWVISLYAVSNNGTFQPVKICNGVLLSKTKFLSVKTCFEFGGDIITKAHVGRCNVTEVPDSELLSINTTVQIDETDLRIVELESEIKVDWNLNLLPVCLPDDKTEFRTDDNSCVIASRSFGQGIVVSSRVTILPKIACDNIKDGTNSQTEGTFCTSKHDGFVIDEGDQGGVVMCPDQNNHWTLKGVINKGRSDPEDTDEIIDIEAVGTDLIGKIF